MVKGDDKMKLKVNENCIGCGACASICPDVFEVEDGQAKVVAPITDEVKEDAINAKEGCPVDAIEEVKEDK